MKMLKILFGFIAIIAIFSFKSSDKSAYTIIGNTVNDFSLKNTDNKSVSLSDFKKVQGFIVVFTCNHCPFAKLYSQRYNDLNKKYQKKGVPLVAINSMDTLAYEEESFVEMQKKAKTEKFTFPYLQDGSQAVGKNFGADHTPHAYIIWKENDKWVIKYSGGVDDNGEHPEKATPFLANALEDLLHHRPILSPETTSFGCKIFYRK